MNIEKKILLSLFSILFILVVTLSLSSAAVTLNRPAASSGMGGAGISFNVTVPETDSGTNFTCKLYAQSTLTANSSWVLLATAHNNTAGGGLVNQTNSSFSSLVLEDANNYQFNATCWNQTNWIDDAVNTAVTVDNTIPQAPTSLSPTSDTDGSVDFSATVTSANTTSCTLFFPNLNPGSSSYSMTHSGGTCTATVNPMAEQGYDWYVRASDETNTTDSSTENVRVDLSTSSGKTALLYNAGLINNEGKTLDTDPKENILNKPIFWISVIIVITLIILIRRR